MRWTPRWGLVLLAALVPATSALVPGYENVDGDGLARGVLLPRQTTAVPSPPVTTGGTPPPGTTTPPPSTTSLAAPPSSSSPLPIVSSSSSPLPPSPGPDVTRFVTIVSTSVVGRTSTTTVLTTVISTVFVTSTSFATVTVTNSNVETATATQYVTSTQYVKRALLLRRTVMLDMVPRMTAVPRHEKAPWDLQNRAIGAEDQAAAAGLQKRATIVLTVTQVAVVTSDVIATRTNVVVQQEVAVTTSVSTLTTTSFANARTTVTVTSSLTVTSTSMTTDQLTTYTAPQDLPSDIASSVTIGPPTTSSTDGAAPGSSSGGLSTGAIAGIAAGAGVATLALLAALIAFFLRRRRRNRDSKVSIDYTSGLSAFHDSPDDRMAHLQPTLPNVESIPSPPPVAGAAMMMRPIPKRDANLYDVPAGVAEAPNSSPPPPRYPSAMSGTSTLAKDGRSPSPAAMAHQRMWSDTSELDGAGRYTPGHSPGLSSASAELDGRGGNHRHTMSSGMSELAAGGRPTSPPGVAEMAGGGSGYQQVPTQDPHTVYYEMPERRFT